MTRIPSIAVPSRLAQRFRFSSFASFATFRSLRFPVLLVCLLLLALPSCREEDAPLRRDPRIVTGRLDNGLAYFVRSNDKPKNRLQLRLVVRAGSVLEQDDQQGLAHFLEHMAFNGTEHFEKQKLVDYLESIGMRFGPSLNAYTSFDQTVYQLEVPTDRPDAVETAFRILRDWAFGLRNEDAEIQRERGVIIEEWRLGRGAAQRIRDKQFPVLLKGSQYANRLPIGKKEVLESFPPQRVRDFYREWYRPDLMGVIAVGSLPADDLVKRVREAFADRPAPTNAVPRPEFEVPPHNEDLACVAGDAEATGFRVSVHHKRPPTSLRTVADYRAELLEAMVSSMLNQRLDEIRKKPDPPFLGAGSYKQQYARTRDILTLSADVREGGYVRGLEALLTETERVRRHGFTESEAARMKAELMTRIEKAYNERLTTDSDVYTDSYVWDFLRDRVDPGVEAELALHKALLPGLRLEEMNRLANEWFAPSNRVVLASGPQKPDVRLPAEPELLAVFAQVAARDIPPYVDDVADVPLVRDLPAPGRVTQRGAIPEIGVTTWTLSNGARVILKPTAFKKDELLLRAFSPGGLSRVSDADFIAGSSADGILGECGLGPFSQSQLQKKLAGKTAHVSAFISEIQEGLSGSCRPEELETMLQLLYLRFTAPRKDPDAYAAYCQRTRTHLQHRLAQPENVFWDEVKSGMSGDHPRYRPWKPETVDQFDLDRSLDVYRKRFAGAGDFVFFLVGNLDLKTAEPLVRRYIGGLPAGNTGETWTDDGMRPPDNRLDRLVQKGVEPKSRVHMVHRSPIRWEFPERLRREALTRVLDIILREKIREELGGTYHVAVYPILTHYPVPYAQVRISFGCAPDQIEKLTAAIARELASLKTKPVDETYLKKVKETLRREREVQLEENGFWTSFLSYCEWHGEDPRTVSDFEKRVDALTLDDIQRTAAACFDTPHLATFILKPAPRQVPSP